MLAASRVLWDVREHAHVQALAARVAAVTEAAHGAKKPELLTGEEVAELARQGLPELGRDQAGTAHGNVLEILDRGPSNGDEWLLLGALWAIAAEERPATDVAGEAMWLATETELPALLFVDGALSEERRQTVWRAVATATTNANLSPATRAALASALSFSTSAEGIDAAKEAFDATSSPLVQLILAWSSDGLREVSGNVSAARSRLRTVLLALSGLLFVVSMLQLSSRVLLGFRRRGQLSLQAGGVALSQSTEVLGKRMKSVERFVPFEQIVAVRRESRHGGGALYAGIVMLALGTYVGTGLLADAVRTPGGSPSLLGLGLLAIAVGVILDFVLFRLSGLTRRTARIVVEPRRGRGIVIQGPSETEADAWIARATRVWGRE